MTWLFGHSEFVWIKAVHLEEKQRRNRIEQSFNAIEKGAIELTVDGPFIREAVKR